MSWMHEKAVIVGTKHAKLAEATDMQKEELIYAYERLLNNGALILGLFMLTNLIALISSFNITRYVMIYYGVATLIRYSFGGWHTEKDITCLVLSVCIPIIVGFLVIFMNFKIEIIVSIYFLAYVIGIKIGVVDNPNKRLTPKQKKVFQIIGLVELTIIFLIHIYFYTKGDLTTSNSILLAVFVGFGNLLFGK